MLSPKLYYMLYRYHSRHRIISGLPPGISAETINAICVEQLGGEIQDVAHVPLSVWKPDSVFRLLITTVRGNQGSLIFKQIQPEASDNGGEMSSVVGRSGTSEFVLYSHASEPLRRFLPAVYFCQEIVPGERYQFVFEDLRPRFRPMLNDVGEFARIVSQLRTLHEALRPLQGQFQSARVVFPIADEFADRLEKIRRILDRYDKQYGSHPISAILSAWSRISAVAIDEDFYQHWPQCLIHNDMGLPNVHVDTRNPLILKFIDWEDAGIGPPHMDLAGLLKNQDPDVETKVLEQYSRVDPSLSYTEHMRLYTWCQFNRSLIDTAFHAERQILSTSPRDWVWGYIEASATHLLHSYERLVNQFRHP
jgi:hypothetical protein